MKPPKSTFPPQVLYTAKREPGKPDNTGNPGQINESLETILSQYPDKVALGLFNWRKATLEREKTEALLYTEFKAGEGKRTADEIKALVRSHDDRYKAVLAEIKAEARYTQLNETLLSAKKQAAMRTAF